MANPSLGYTVTEQGLASALTTDPETVFRTECLCQRVPDMRPDWAIIGEDAWMRLAADPPDQTVLAPVAVSVDVTPERSHASIGVAGRAGGLLHVELADYRRGTGWVVPRLVELVETWQPCAVVVAKNSPAGSLIADMEAAGLEVTTPSTGDEAQACGAIIDAAVPNEGEPTLRHPDQEPLNAAVRGAVKAHLGDGAWRLSRRNSTVDISPLVAVTLAAWGHATKSWQADGLPPNLW
jgi:hypothetical protein